MNQTGQHFYFKGQSIEKEPDGSMQDYDDLLFIVAAEDSGNYASYFKNTVFPTLSINDFGHVFSGNDALYVNDYFQTDFLALHNNLVDTEYSFGDFPTGAAAINSLVINNGSGLGIKDYDFDHHIWFEGDSTLVKLNQNPDPFELNTSGIFVAESSIEQGLIVLDGSGDNFVEVRPFAEGVSFPAHYGMYIGESQIGLPDEQISNFRSYRKNSFLGTDVYGEENLTDATGEELAEPSGEDLVFLPVDYESYQSSFLYNGGKSKSAIRLTSFNKGNTINIDSPSLNSEANFSFTYGPKCFGMGSDATTIGYSCAAFNNGRAENAGELFHPQASIDGYSLDIRKKINLLGEASTESDDYLFEDSVGLSKISDSCNLMNLALGEGAFVINRKNYVRGNYSHGEGILNVLHSSDLSNKPSHVEGSNNSLGAILSHVEGENNVLKSHLVSLRLDNVSVLTSSVEGSANFLIGAASVGGDSNYIFNKTSDIFDDYIVRDEVYGNSDFPSHVFGKSNVSEGVGNHVIGLYNGIDDSVANSVRGSYNLIVSGFGENALNAAYGNVMRRGSFSEGERNTSDHAYNFFKGSYCKSFFTNGFFAGEGHLGNIGDSQYFETKLTNHVDLAEWVSGDFVGQELELFIKTCDDEDTVVFGEYLFIPNFSNVNFDVEFTVASSNGLFHSDFPDISKPIHSTFRSSGRIIRDFKEDRLVEDSFGYGKRMISGTEYLNVEGSDAKMLYFPCHSTHASGTTASTEFAGKREIEFFTGVGSFASNNQDTSFSDFVQPKMMFNPVNGKLTLSIDPINLDQFDYSSLSGTKDLVVAEAKIRGNIITKLLNKVPERITIECFNNSGIVEPPTGTTVVPPVTTIVPPVTTIVPPVTLVPGPTYIPPAPVYNGCPVISWLSTSYNTNDWDEVSDKDIQLRIQASFNCGGSNDQPQFGTATGTFTVPDGFVMVYDWSLVAYVEQQDAGYDEAELKLNGFREALIESEGVNGGCTSIRKEVSKVAQEIPAGIHAFEVSYNTDPQNVGDGEYHDENSGVRLTITNCFLRAI